MGKDYYAILGVARGADSPTIHSAFRALARRYHPDTGNASSPGQFREVLEAYHALRDPAQRRQHDIDLGFATRETRIVAEPLFSPFPPAARTIPRYQSPTLDDLFSEMLRLFEGDFNFHLRFF